MTNDQERALQELSDLSQEFERAFKEFEREEEAYWNSLTKEQQLMVFCCVARRLCNGELVTKGSYRYVLYEVFGFGPEAYVRAQMAGFLSLHNAIDPDY